MTLRPALLAIALVLTDNDLYTLPVALANLAGEHAQDTELMMAGSVLTVLPVLVLFLAFLVLSTLRALGLLTWRIEQLETVTPSRIGRDGIKLGKKAPEFTLPVAKPRPVVAECIDTPRLSVAEELTAANGRGFEEASLHDFLGRKLLLVFTQSGCGPCRASSAAATRGSGSS